MRPISHVVVNLCVDTLWRVRPYARRSPHAPPSSLPTDDNATDKEELTALRALIRRFPYWMQGRALVAKISLEADDIATAYAEAQALLALAPGGSHYHAVALFDLGRCFLRRHDAASALAFLDQAHELRPQDPRIQEERSAAIVVQGDKVRALEILKTIPSTELSAEGKAALQWLAGDA